MSVDLYSIGFYCICIVLIAIVAAFILSDKFRNDVISSQGEGSFFGLSVQGVTIVVLTALLIGAIVYLSTNKEAGEIKRYTTNDAFTYLNGIQDDEYTLYKTSGFLNILGVDRKQRAESFIGQLHKVTDEMLTAKKDYTNFKKWKLQLDSTQFGFVRLKTKAGLINSRSSGNLQYYTFDNAYNVPNTDLMFKIERCDVQMINDKRTAKYSVRFGEKNQIDNTVFWENDVRYYYKTDNGQIDYEQGLNLVDNKHWNSMYYVCLGLGFWGIDEEQGKKHVQMVNLNAVQIYLE